MAIYTVRVPQTGTKHYFITILNHFTGQWRIVCYLLKRYHISTKFSVLTGSVNIIATRIYIHRPLNDSVRCVNVYFSFSRM